MGLLDKLNNLKKESSTEDFKNTLIKYLSELNKAFESKNLSIIQSNIQMYSKLIKKEGKLIHEKDGLEGMQNVYKLVQDSTNSDTVANLSFIWDGVGKWLN